jgi:SSS family solute:Na+ symporter
MILALFASHFGGVIGIVILWYGALSAPIAIPILLGLLLPFRQSGPAAAIGCWAMGAVTFGALKLFPLQDWLALSPRFLNAFTVGAPMFAALITYIAVGFISHPPCAARTALLMALDSDVEETALPLR